MDADKAPWWTDALLKVALNVPVAMVMIVLIWLLFARDDRMIEAMGRHLEAQVGLIDEQNDLLHQHLAQMKRQAVALEQLTVGTP